MSLLTPPSTSHRSDKDKENKFSVAGPSTRSVVWAAEFSFHDLSSPPKVESVPSRQRPHASRSILKTPSQGSFLDVPAVSKPRELTPEPKEILRDLTYLARPISQITSQDDPNSLEALRQLIEGYNVLAVRMRDAVTESAEADSTWPLFQPLRQNKAAFVDAVVRDLGRALVDPLSLSPSTEEELPPKLSLPSPQKTPVKKKKGGMTAEQVKFARDLCTTCHSVIKTLSVILSLPALHGLFEDAQLRRILTAILAIPLSDSLPTPNARKSCALAIWLIQIQRLPATILRPAADRIAYAIRRGIDGELGKEGKKGSAHDGLKAVSDLCKHLPEVFVPAFAQLLPSICSNLLAPTLVLRTQACHALGGFAVNLSSLPPSIIHTQVASAVASYLTAPPTPIKINSPTKPAECAIIRTLRATMNQQEPVNAAQGPVWGLSVLANFIVLLNSRLQTDSKVSKVVSTLVGLGVKHKKSSVRGLTALAWRCLIWAYVQPPLPVSSDEESEIDDEVRQKPSQTHHTLFKIMMSVLDMQTGISAIGAILGDEESLVSEEPLRKALSILEVMASRSGRVSFDASQTMMQLVSAVNGDADEPEAWDHHQLIPKPLLMGTGTLFTCDFKNLLQAVRPIYEEMPSLVDIRPLTREELTKDWVIDGLMTAWRSALGFLELGDTTEMPLQLGATWSGLLKANVSYYQDDQDDASTIKFATTAVKYLVEILQDSKLNLVPSQDATGAAGPANEHKLIPDSDDTVIDHDMSGSKCSNDELRLRMVQYMWTEMKITFPASTLPEAAEIVLACLMRNSTTLMTNVVFELESDESETVMRRWVSLCIDVIAVCEADVLRTFWACEEGTLAKTESGGWTSDWSSTFKNAVWRMCADKWKSEELSWGGGVLLLGIPFIEKHAGIMSTSDDYNLWEDLLTYTSAKALDHGIDSVTVLDNIASLVSSFQTGTLLPTSVRLADLLLSHLDMDEMRNLPQDLFEHVAEVMRIHYPPPLANEKPPMRWLARSLTSVIEHCPNDFCSKVLEIFQDSVCHWLADKEAAWTEEEMAYDLIPLYQHVILRIQQSPASVKTVETFAPYMGSIFQYRTLTAAVTALSDAWPLVSAQLSVPAAGWPEPLRQALKSVYPSDQTQLTPKSPSLDSAFEALPATPSTSISTPAALDKEGDVTCILSPQRPQKVFGKFPLVPSSPISPTVSRRLQTSNRTPLSAIQVPETPSKRRRLDSNNGVPDKENVSLKTGPLVSVAERIAEMLKPGGSLKKRKFDSLDDSDPSISSTPVPVKRLRSRMKPKISRPSAGPTTMNSPASTSSCSGSEDERRLVEKALQHVPVPFPSLGGTNDIPQFPLHGLRRAGQSPKAAGIPLRKPAVTLNDTFRKIDLAKVRKTIKRSVSIPNTMLGVISSTGKRKRVYSDLEDDSDLYDLTKLDPIPALHIAPLFTSKRSVSMPVKRHAQWPNSDDTVISASSDDSAHVGQVTPYHIISPEIPKGKFDLAASLKPIRLDANKDSLFGSDDTVSGSDDSSESDESPTKEVVNRHFGRSNSQSWVARTLLSR
ncbi:hypothetical protein CPB83DRAFT_862112 [Crepidotus variabilis]|uniref:Telomere-associated protein Rif1 N-terminal domain-containing protein n=1 Tax=Crepidotus variabilis TaxID=179855 RepID=A0A9P6E7P1_9AGAR|nr:hypothetical protein CPB83DRAFT_862112 [Crepidotus variabilis]